MMDNSCFVCGVEANWQCQACHEAYCSTKCQCIDWPEHRNKCRLPPHISGSGTKQSLRVVHVSGIPGSGKSTLGERIARELNFRMVDTDDLIQHNTPFGDELLKLEEQHEKASPIYLARWREIFSSQIQREIDKAKVADARIIIFVGILDHWGQGADPITIPEPVSKFYISIPVPLLLFQFYTRYTKLFSREDSFWSDIADGRDEIPSSRLYMNDAVKKQRWHEEHGYVSKTSDEIYRLISELFV